METDYEGEVRPKNVIPIWADNIQSYLIGIRCPG